VYIETESAIEDGRLTALRKLKIEGTDDELRTFALHILDALDEGKTKFRVDETRVVVKRVEPDS
jgi:hypothetical protein